MAVEARLNFTESDFEWLPLHSNEGTDGAIGCSRSDETPFGKGIGGSTFKFAIWLHKDQSRSAAKLQQISISRSHSLVRFS
jgi:hypothetical protein